MNPEPKPPVHWAFARVALVVGTLVAGGCGDGDGPGPSDPGPGPDPIGPPHLVQVAPATTPRTAIPGGLVDEPVVVTVLDAEGRAVPHAWLTVEILAGGGWVPDPNPRADAGGRASIAWHAGPTPADEVQRLRVRSGSAVAEVEARIVHAVPGEIYAGHRDFVEYIPGTLPVVLTAPHGGTLVPSDLPDRAVGTLVRDAATDTLALLVAEALEAETGARPHLVRVHLHRRKLDANRDLSEGAQGDPDATRAWLEFHAWTEAAMEAVRAAHARGLYVDLHGHGHEIQRLELGYLLSGSELALPDSLLDAPDVAARSSLREVPAWSDIPFHALIRGPASLGAWFAEEGYPAVPSPGDPHPDGAPYFAGGYNTRRYGCSEGGTICGFQLEANRIGVRDSAASLAAFALATAKVIVRFLDTHVQEGPPGTLQSGFPASP
jgi:N-formylglutamate amidohydrolase